MKNKNIYIISFAIGLFLIAGLVIATDLLGATSKDMSDKDLTILKNYMVANGSIGRNATGVYGCSSASAWVKLF